MTLGLRAKSVLALCSCIAVVLALAAFAGWRTLGAVEENLGSAFARNITLYNKQRILTPVLRELALSQRLTESEVTRRWMLNQNDPAAKALFFAEAEHYRHAFADHSYSAAGLATRDYYFNDDHHPFSERPRTRLDPANPADAWFFNTMKNTRDFNINVDYDHAVDVTKVWFNVITKVGERGIGMAGTGLDLTTFLNRFINQSETGVTPIIVNDLGYIQAYPDRKLIDFATINDKGAQHSTIYKLLPTGEDQDLMRAALGKAAANEERIPVFWADLDGRRQLFAVSSVPQLNWFVVTAVDLQAARVIDNRLWLVPLVIGCALLGVLVAGMMFAVNRIVLAPLFKLTDSARAMAGGNYELKLPPAGNDELGELSRAFGVMAAQVRSHTDELESRVRERTSELTVVNQQMAEANKKIGDSIRYASLIQNAILPNRELARTLADRYFVLWRPRDVVGGDYYVFRAHEHGCLLGVVDCAGHGVAGALMTMIAHTVVNIAIDTLGISDPAALLTQVDSRFRAMLHADPNYAQLATHMDAGLAYIDFDNKTVTFSGAKVSLYWCDGQSVAEMKGERQAIGGKRLAEFTNQTAVLDPAVTFYLTTDGFLDQAGGPNGYSFGAARFGSLLKQHAGRPFSEQRAAFAEELERYQGDLAQRDDITVLSFRFQ